MQMADIPFGTTDWSAVPGERHDGESGEAIWRTRHFGPADNPIRVRMVEYSAGYISNHWCEKGHILLCLAGELETELKDGSRVTLTTGMSYQVADDTMAHRSSSGPGATLFIVD
jgi:quercetin dioxygenase-like cupin family protein